MIDTWISLDYVEENMLDTSITYWDHPSRTRYWENIYHHLDKNQNSGSNPKFDIANSLIQVSMTLFLLDSLSKQLSPHTLKEILVAKNDCHDLFLKCGVI